MKKFLLAILIVLYFFSSTTTFAAEKPVPIEVFERPDCQHCQDEKAFLLELKLERDDFTVRFHNIDEQEHYEHWVTLTELEGLPKVTPITLVGNVILQGFDSAETTGKRIKQLLDQSKGKTTLTFEELIAAGGSGNVEAVTGGTCDEETGICAVEEEPFLVTLPLFGIVDLKEFSLPTLSFVLGFVDGFNPCAMWVLITFLVVLTQVGSKKKMWQVAGLFILAEAIMYYLILNVWFTAWDFVKLDNIVTPLVGLVAMGGGVYFLHKWRTFDGTCQVTSSESQKKTFSKINLLASAELTLLTALGIIGLAFSVNIIEFACSIGVPQAFTKILELNALDFLQRQLYMAVYILAYMVDDFLVFGIALYSFEKIGVTTKYSRWVTFIGGILMLILGAMLVFRPEWLVL